MRPYGRLLLSIAIFRALSGIMFLLFFDPSNSAAMGLCLFLFITAQASDHVDGWIARHFSTPNLSGYLQDSVSDKIFHFGCLLAFTMYFDWIAPAVWLICCREFLILALRTANPHVMLSIKKFKWQSVLYAFFMRAGILMGVVSQLGNSELFVFHQITYASLIYTASIIGAINIAIVFRWHYRSDTLRQGQARNEQASEQSVDKR